MSDVRLQGLLAGCSVASLLLLLLVCWLPPPVTCLRSPYVTPSLTSFFTLSVTPSLISSMTSSLISQRSPSRVTRATRQRVDGDQTSTFTLASPISEEEAVQLRLFGRRLADVSGVSLELRRDDGSQTHRRLQPVPRRGEGFLSELRWSVCGAAGVDTVMVRVHWRHESDQNGRRIYCHIHSKNVLLEDGGEWGIRLGRVEFRRLRWPAASEDGPAAVLIRSPDVTGAIACLKHECVDDSEIDSLSADDVTCQEFTNCATFDIEQGRPSFLYVRPRAATSRQIGKQVQVRFDAGPAPPEWTTHAPAPAPATPGGHRAAECRRHRLGTLALNGLGLEAQGRQEGPGSEEQEQDSREEQEGEDGNRIKTTPAKRPVTVLLRTSVTMYRPKQTELTPRQAGHQTEQTSGQRRQGGAAGAAGEGGASSGGSGQVPGAGVGPAAGLLALAAVARLLLCEM